MFDDWISGVLLFTFSSLVPLRDKHLHFEDVIIVSKTHVTQRSEKRQNSELSFFRYLIAENITTVFNVYTALNYKFNVREKNKFLTILMQLSEFFLSFCEQTILSFCSLIYTPAGNVVRENFLKVQSEFSVQSTTKICLMDKH